VQLPVIGVEFLSNYGLLVDGVGNRLADRLTLQAFYCCPPDPGSFPFILLWPRVFGLLLTLTGETRFH
jgi:hypothetical protein